MMTRVALIIGLLLSWGSGACAQALQQAPGAGATPKHYLSTAADNATLVKAGATTLYGAQVLNTTVTLYYLKLYDKKTAPVCQTDAVLKTIPIPFSSGNAGGGVVIEFPAGLSFVTGLGFCLVANIADNDDTSAATGVAINLDIK